MVVSHCTIMMLTGENIQLSRYGQLSPRIFRFSPQRWLLQLLPQMPPRLQYKKTMSVRCRPNTDNS